MALESYEWIVVCAGLAMAFMAWGIGANDVANAFATSVGSKALTLKQACIAAAIFEFTGAVSLGAAVSSTVQGGIASSSVFKNDPDIFMYGMLCALTAASIWLAIATYFSLPVSTTHSIVGGVFGFALVYGGKNAVRWWEPIDDFPYRRGMGIIVLGWVIAPVMCGVAASLAFLTLRTCVLRTKNPVRVAVITLPIVVFFAIWANMWFVLYKGIKGVKTMSKEQANWISAVCGAGCGLVAACFMPYLLKMVDEGRIKSMDDVDEKAKEDIEKAAVDAPADRTKNMLGAITGGMTADIHNTALENTEAARIHANAEVFDPRAEGLYTYAQIFSACCDSFSHGANDVANSVAPFAAIYHVYKFNGKISSTSETPKWMLALGGLFIVVGLATYGQNIIRALGVQTAKITPTRGFCIEMSSALVIAIGSGYGLPLSTTHCQVGATWGVGFCEGVSGVNLLFAAKFFAGWVMTILVAAGTSALLFSQGVYSPTLQKDIVLPKSKSG